MFENKKTLWVVHISNHEPSAIRAQQEGFMCIGWTRMGDLTVYDTREKMKAAYKKYFPNDSDAQIRACYGQVFRFAHEMKIGDPVVYPIKGSRDILIGEVAGPYRWASDDKELFQNDYCNYRKVTWHRQVPRIAFSQDALHSFSSFTSVSTSDDHLEEVVTVLKNTNTIATASKPTNETALVKAEVLEKDIQVNLAERAIEETEDYLIRQWTGTKQQFEKVVAAVFRAMGYTAQVQQGVHDLGVDVIAHPDPLGVQPPLLKIQAKSGTTKIGSKEVKELRGLLNDREKGVLVSLGGFSTDARHVQQNDADLVLIDADRFVQLFLSHYDRLDPETRNQFPLRSVFVYVGKSVVSA